MEPRARRAERVDQRAFVAVSPELLTSDNSDLEFLFHVPCLYSLVQNQYLLVVNLHMCRGFPLLFLILIMYL